MRVVQGHCTPDTLQHTFNISMFKCSKNNATTIKYIYNESANLIGSCDVAFNTNDWLNLP